VFEPDLQFFMASFFAFLGLAVAGWHLATAPSPLRAHLEPFARFGKLGWLAGSWMQPGWPGAILFVLVLEGLMAAFTRSVPAKAASTTEAVYIMLGAALLTPPLLRVLFWRRFKHPLVADFLVHCLSCAFVGGVAQVSKAALNSPGFLFFPPAALWALFRGTGFRPENFGAWFSLWLSLPLGLGLLGLLCSRRYWRKIAGLSAEVAAARRARTASKPPELP
jgi:hypothetical protein